MVSNGLGPLVVEQHRLLLAFRKQKALAKMEHQSAQNCLT